MLLLNGHESPRLKFRKLRAEDFKPCLEFFLDPRSNRYWKSELTDPRDLAREWFDKQMWRYENEKGGMNLLFHKQSNELIGWCGLLVQTVDEAEELEIGYSIIPRHWQNGYATEAARTCMNHAFKNNVSPSLISIIHEQNIESENVALKNGMKLDKKTIYHNNPVHIFRIRKNDWEDEFPTFRHPD